MQYIKKHSVLQIGLFSFFLASLRFFPFFLGKTLYFADNYSLMVPGKLFTAFWLQRGVVPLWNPLLFSGLPWVADINQSVLYFSSIFFIWFHPAIGLNINVFVHYIITGLGMWFLANKFVKQKWQAFLAVILWVFSTQLAGSTNNLSTLQSLVWMPWVVYLGFNVQKTFFAKFIFSFVVLLQFLGGYPQHVIYSIFFAVVISGYDLIGEKNWRSKGVDWFVNWFKTALITILMSALAWLPFAEVLLNSTRMLQSIEQSQVGSLDPSMLVKPFLPYFFDMQLLGMKWGPAWNGQPNVVFVITGFGILTILASLVSWKHLDRWVKFFALFSLFSIIFALGKNLPFFEFIQQVIPLFKFSRGPSMILILTNVSVILWFARYLPKLKISDKWLKLLVSTLIVSTIVAALGLGAVRFQMNLVWSMLNSITQMYLQQSEFHTLAKDQVILSIIFVNLLMVGLLTLANLFAWSTKRIGLLLIFIIIEMWMATQGMFFFANNSVYPSWRRIENRSDTFQIIDDQHRLLTRNSNMPYTDYFSYWEALVVRAPFSDSFIDEQELRTQVHLKRIRDGLTPDWNTAYQVPVVNGFTTLLPTDYQQIWQTSEETRINFVDYIDINNPLLNEWSVKYYLVDDWYPNIENMNQHPVVWQEDHLTLYEFTDALPRFRYSDNSPVGLQEFKETSNQINFSFISDREEKIIIADRYDTNWRAYVNGEEVEIKNINGMRGISVEPGNNELVMLYVPMYFYLGLIITLTTLIVGGILAWKLDKLKI